MVSIWVLHAHQSGQAYRAISAAPAPGGARRARARARAHARGTRMDPRVREPAKFRCRDFVPAHSQSAMPGAQRWSMFVLLTACCAGAASGQCLWDLQADGVPVDGVVAPHTEVSGGANDQVNYCLQVQAGVTYDFVVALGGASCQECLWDSCVVLVRAVGPLLTIPHPLARAQAAPSLG